MLTRIVFFVAVLLCTQVPANSEDAHSISGSLSLAGLNPEAIPITPELLSSLPATEQDVTFQTSKGISSGHYKGVLVWDLLKALKAFDGLQHNAELRKALLVEASDGYEIIFSIGEIHPDFGNTPVMLVMEINGKPTGNNWQFVVPGDKRGARAIHDVVSIALK